MQLVGVSGWPNSGKGEVARALNEVGWMELAFADPLTKRLSILNPIIEQSGMTTIRWNDAMEHPGYRAAKDLYPEIRRLMHGLGTRVIRETMNEDWFVEEMEQQFMDFTFMEMQSIAVINRVVIPDVRFANEARLIEKWGGIVIRVERPGNTEPESEIEHHLDGYPFKHTIVNDQRLVDLREKVYDTVERL